MADITAVATKLGREATEKARAFAETNSVAKKAKDVVYTAVGLGVMGAQKATHAVKSVQGHVDTDGVSASVKKSVDDVTTSVKRQATKVDAQVGKVVKTIDEKVAPLEEKLPAPVRDAAAKARDARTKVHSAVTSKVTTPAEATVTDDGAAEAPKADKK